MYASYHQCIRVTESVASSKIERLEAGPRRLLDAEVALARGGDAADRIAVEVLANVAAMEAAVELGGTSDTIAIGELLSVHRIRGFGKGAASSHDHVLGFVVAPPGIQQRRHAVPCTRWLTSTPWKFPLLFAIAGTGRWALSAAIVLLLFTVSGYYPRAGLVVLWWVAVSVFNSMFVVEGGEPVIAVTALLLLPITVFDRRRHARQSLIVNVGSNDLASRARLCSQFAVQVQISVIYMHSALA
jgi:hypothetical protein